MLKFLVALFLTSAAAFAADEYKLQMERPEKLGDRHSVTGTGQLKQRVELKIDGEVFKSDSVEIDVEYEVERETVAVNEMGKASDVRVKLLKIAGRYNGAPITQLKNGDVIESKSEKADLTYLVNGEGATPAQECLAKLLPKSSTLSAIKDDEAFGPGRLIKVGDEWPVNAAAAAKQSADNGLPGIQSEGVKGHVKLLEITNRTGQPCLKVRGAFEVSGSGMGVPKGPPELKVTQFSSMFTVESDFPVNSNVIVPRNDSEMKTQMAAAGDMINNGRTHHIEFNSEMNLHDKSEVKPIK